MRAGSGDEIDIYQERQVSKTAEHARAVPAINVTKWRTTNKVLPRSLASRQSARGEKHGLSETNNSSCLSRSMFREIGSHYPHDNSIYLAPFGENVRDYSKEKWA